MILVRTQCSLNKDHQRPKWQPQKSWTLYPDFQDVQVKQLMQYPLTRSSKWKMHRCHWEFERQNAQIFGYVNRSTNSPNNGLVWKTQSFSSKGICTVTLWQDYHGKGNLGKFYWNTVWTKFQIGNVYLSTEQKGLPSSVHVDGIKMAGKTENISPKWKIMMTDVDLEEPFSFFDHVYFGLHSKRVYTK